MAAQTVAPEKEIDPTKPQAMAIPKEGYFNLKNGRYGPLYPRTPACYGFTIIAKVKPGREGVIRGLWPENREDNSRVAGSACNAETSFSGMLDLMQ